MRSKCDERLSGTTAPGGQLRGGYNAAVHLALFVIAVVIAVAGLAVAVRFLYLAWRDVHLGRDRRSGADRRQRDMPVPMERRRRRRRS